MTCSQLMISHFVTTLKTLNSLQYLFSGVFTKLQKKKKRILTSSWFFTWKNSAPARWIFIEFRTHVFPKMYRENTSFIKIWQKQRVLYLKKFSYLWQYFAKLLLKWNFFQTKGVVKFKAHVLCSVIFFPKSCRLWDNAKKLWWNQRGHRWQ
jgi:hypothetical protein